MSASDHVEIQSLKALRDWLAENHASAGTLWLVMHKKHTDFYIPINEIIDELLCWGWVDSVTGKVDADRSKIRISPRNPKSAWSKVNKDKVARLRAEGRMQPAGEAVIARAMENGMWTFLDDVERLEVPGDLDAALGGLRAGWEAYPRSVKRGALEWLKTAKTMETRKKRISDVVESLHAGLRPSPFRR